MHESHVVGLDEAATSWAVGHPANGRGERQRSGGRGKAGGGECGVGAKGGGGGGGGAAERPAEDVTAASQTYHCALFQNGGGTMAPQWGWGGGPGRAGGAGAAGPAWQGLPAGTSNFYLHLRAEKGVQPGRPILSPTVPATQPEMKLLLALSSKKDGGKLLLSSLFVHGFAQVIEEGVVSLSQGSSREASVRAESLLASLPWLLEQFCVAAARHLRLLAAGVWQLPGVLSRLALSAWLGGDAESEGLSRGSVCACVRVVVVV
eukprot:233617-Chlamydomonas_euryale.AAC.1